MGFVIILPAITQKVLVKAVAHLTSSFFSGKSKLHSNYTEKSEAAFDPFILSTLFSKQGVLRREKGVNSVQKFKKYEAWTRWSRYTDRLQENLHGRMRSDE